MNNPWLSIPLVDYEGHMASPAVGQAQMLAVEFEALLASYQPSSVALIGCAGGNGFDQARRMGVTRLVGIDINAHYITDARQRYAISVPGLELYCADVQDRLPQILGVELVYAALVFEYVDVAATLRNLSRLCQPNGVLVTLVQLPKQGAEAVTPSSFTSLQKLATIMQLVPPHLLSVHAQAAGFTSLSNTTITLESGKQFCLQAFRLTSPVLATSSAV